jgi:hypothetical protein
MTLILLDRGHARVDVFSGKSKVTNHAISRISTFGLLPVLLKGGQLRIHSVKNPGHRMVFKKRCSLARDAFRMAERHCFALGDELHVIPVQHFIDAFTQRRDERYEGAHCRRRRARKK